jgi:hypothetical protein
MHLTPKGIVENRIKILEYLSVCSVFDSVFVAPLGVVYFDRLTGNRPTGSIW